MRYFANPSTVLARKAMQAGLLDAIVTPGQGGRGENMPSWCADNSCFGGDYPGDDGFIAWLEALLPHQSRCVFAVAPDVPMDMAASLQRSRSMLARIRSLGYPVALAAQNGAENLTLPWDDFDVLFLGGDTAWTRRARHVRRERR